MAGAEKKNSKAGFYFFMALLLACVAAYAGLPFFIHKAPVPVEAPVSAAP